MQSRLMRVRNVLRFFHPVLESLAANELHGLHQGAGGVAQQDPIDRVVNVGAQAGRVQERALQIHRLGQAQLVRSRGAHARSS